MSDTNELWSSTEINKAYNEENYKVIDIDKNSKLCYIFFSSNGLYYPNTVKEFSDVVMINDKYDWEKVARCKKLLRKAGRFIFVRDIYKQWYVTGINRRYNSINSLEKLLLKLTKGYNVITAGSSSGGYAAVIMGIKLEAIRIFSFSGQFSIISEIQDYYLLKKFYQDHSYSQYYDLCPFLKKCNIPVFYFYPAECIQDFMQYKLVEGMDCVFPFAIKSHEHGKTLKIYNFQFVLTKEEKKLIQICERLRNRIVSPETMVLLTANLMERLIYAHTGKEKIDI